MLYIYDHEGLCVNSEYVSLCDRFSSQGRPFLFSFLFLYNYLCYIFDFGSEIIPIFNLIELISSCDLAIFRMVINFDY